jgi:Xaa-Pro aminopeptidase
VVGLEQPHLEIDVHAELRFPLVDRVSERVGIVRGLEAAEAAGRPGLPASELFAALLGPIAAAGYGAGFRFHGGHALGLEHLERPYVIPGDPMPLAEGMVLALEPGVYLPEVGGLRVEENYVVTARGLERLSRAPRELVVCPAA